MRKSINIVVIVAAWVAAAATAPRTATAAFVAVTNSGFEDTTGLTPSGGNFNNDNNYDFTTNPFNGWTKLQGGVMNNGVGIGPINPQPADIDTPTEQTTPGGKMALHMKGQDPSARVLVLQTTGHTISLVDASFTLSVDVGKSFVDYAGHLIGLYADNGGTKTIIKQWSYYPLITFPSDSGFANYNGGVVDDSAATPPSKTWINRTVSLSQSDIAPYVGQNIGIALSFVFNGSNNILFYDTVSLSNELVPEPSSLGVIACAAGAAMVVRRRRPRGS
jgi:hypothetical protein